MSNSEAQDQYRIPPFFEADQLVLRALRIYEGTSEIQKWIIARELLKATGNRLDGDDCMSPCASWRKHGF